MSRQLRQTLLGVTFLVVGLALVGLSVLPVVLAALERPHHHVDPSYLFLAIGLGVAIYGALLIPSSGAATGLSVFVSTASPWLPRWGARVGVTVDPAAKRPEEPKP